jgi:aminoglycoside phosphotransferase (APT) family kinase protein
MAILHQVPVGGLAAVLPHSVQPGQSWHDDIDAIAASWNALSNAPSIAVTGALTWMKQHADHIGVVKTLVHCDMLLHNILVEDGEVTAVLDWEAAHIGHPGEDVGYVRPVIEQMGVWPQFLEAYYEAGGYRLSQEEIDFFTLLAISRVMNLGQQSREAFDLGRTDDPILADVGAAWIPKMVNRLAGQLVAIVNREG